MKDCETECKPTKACVKLKHINVINVSSCKKQFLWWSRGVCSPQQCRKFMIISTRAIPAYQKSSCIQNVAHDLVGHAENGINLASSFDKISRWKWMSAWCQANLGAKVFGFVCFFHFWEDWSSRLLDLKAMFGFNSWLVYWLHFVRFLFVCILFAVCRGKDLFAGRMKPGKSSWNCKPS